MMKLVSARDALRSIAQPTGIQVAQVEVDAPKGTLKALIPIGPPNERPDPLLNSDPACIAVRALGFPLPRYFRPHSQVGQATRSRKDGTQPPGWEAKGGCRPTEAPWRIRFGGSGCFPGEARWPNPHPQKERFSAGRPSGKPPSCWIWFEARSPRLMQPEFSCMA